MPDAGPPSSFGPAPPVLTPCPDGWREIEGEAGVARCEPWPSGGPRDDCGFDEAHFPGAAGCVRVGPPCPADGWPEGLPADRTIVWVDDDAPPGGDGSSRAGAMRSVGVAVGAAPDAAIVAIAAGRYDEPAAIVVRDGQTLVGACVAETRVTATSGNETLPLIDLRGAGSALRSLSIDGPARGGIGATGEGVVIEDVVVRGARGAALSIYAGSTAARRFVARATIPTSGAPAAGGVRLQAGAQLELEMAAVEGVEGTGLSAILEGSRLDARDVAVRGITAPALGRNYGGVAIRTGAAASLERVVVEGAAEHGIFVDGEGATLSAADLVVRDTAPAADGGAGQGVYAHEGGSVVLARASVERAREAAIQASGLGSAVELRDVIVADALDRDDGTFGRGLEVQAGARATLARVVFSGCREGGVFVDGADSAIDGEDVVVAATIPGGAGRFGMGAWAQSGASLTLRRARFADVRFVGVGAVSGARATLEDVSVSSIAAAACGDSTCPTLAGGFGLSAHFGGALRAIGFSVSEAALCGVVVGEDHLSATAVDLERGSIASSPVGACVQVDGYDLERLRADVEYREVGVPLQATSYELPDALPAE